MISEEIVSGVIYSNTGTITEILCSPLPHQIKNWERTILLQLDSPHIYTYIHRKLILYNLHTSLMCSIIYYINYDLIYKKSWKQEKEEKDEIKLNK